MGALLRGVLPAGVLNVVSGSDEVGGAMTVRPGFAKSPSPVPWPRAAESRRPQRTSNTSRLNSAATILLAEVDPVRIAEKLFWSAFYNCGQICIPIKRVVRSRDYLLPAGGGDGQLARWAKMGDGFEAARRSVR